MSEGANYLLSDEEEFSSSLEALQLQLKMTCDKCNYCMFNCFFPRIQDLESSRVFKSRGSF